MCVRVQLLVVAPGDILLEACVRRRPLVATAAPLCPPRVVASAPTIAFGQQRMQQHDFGILERLAIDPQQHTVRTRSARRNAQLELARQRQSRECARLKQVFE